VLLWTRLVPFERIFEHAPSGVSEGILEAASIGLVNVLRRGGKASPVAPNSGDIHFFTQCRPHHLGFNTRVEGFPSRHATESAQDDVASDGVAHHITKFISERPKKLTACHRAPTLGASGANSGVPGAIEEPVESVGHVAHWLQAFEY
jgi:hypothetical protein